MAGSIGNPIYAIRFIRFPSGFPESGADGNPLIKKDPFDSNLTWKNVVPVIFLGVLFLEHFFET